MKVAQGYRQSESLRAQQGVGMIEILVTLFILSVGLLGVASLQFVGSLSNSDALNRSQAVLVAQQFSERLRASAYLSSNSEGLIIHNDYFDTDLYNFSNLTCSGTATSYNCFCLEVPASIPDCTTGTCSPAEFAQYDAYQVSCKAVATSPNAEIELSCDDIDLLDADTCSAGSRQTILVTWPAVSWRDASRVLNPVCNVDKSDPHDCVALELVL